MKKVLSTVVGLLVLALAVNADDQGDKIAKAYYDLKKPSDSQATATMVLIDAKGSKKSRTLEMFNKNSGDTKQSFVEFKDPADIAGTRFLTISKAGENDQRLYLPALKKTRKISADAKNGDFMGTDLSYYDMEDRSFDDAKYTFLQTGVTISDAAFANMTFDTVEAKSTDANSPYSKSVMYVNSKNHMAYRIEAYGKDGALLKTISFVKIDTISDILVPVQTLVVNHKKGTKTLLQMNNMKVNQGVKNDVFTVQYLER